MKIAVCISAVPDTTSKINFVENNTVFDREGVQFVINPNDEFGLTRAVWFKEKNQAEITVINVGLSDTEAILRKAIAIGADQAVRINANPTDSAYVAGQLGSYLNKHNFDLIITGKESIDFNGGMVHGMLAEMLNIEVVHACTSLEIENNKAEIAREIDGGTEHLSCELPLIISGQKGLVEESDLKIPNMRGIMTARKKVIEVIEAEDIDCKTADTAFEKPSKKAEVELIDAENLDELIQKLHKEAKVI